MRTLEVLDKMADTVLNYGPPKKRKAQKKKKSASESKKRK
jgi:hypothetical protein